MYRRNPGSHDERPFRDGHDYDPRWRAPDMRDSRDWEGDYSPRRGPMEEQERFPEEPMSYGHRRRRLSGEHMPPQSADFHHGRHRSPPDHIAEGHMEHRRFSPMTFEDAHAPFPEEIPSLFAVDVPHKRPPGSWHEHNGGHSQRHERGQRGSGHRGRPFHRSQERKHDQAEQYYFPEEHHERHRERSPFSDRLHPKRAEFRDHRPDRRKREDREDHYQEHGAPFAPYNRGPGPTPLIVEHDHGISHAGVVRDGERDLRSHRAYHSRSPEQRQRRDRRHEEPRIEVPPKRKRSPSPVAQSRHELMRGHGPPHHFQQNVSVASAQDVDLRTAKVNQAGYHDQEKIRQRSELEAQRPSDMPPYQHRDPSANRPIPKGPQISNSDRETLKIKVDMSRPAGQDSSHGGNTDRQLSLDLVNVGRQRLDFLPLLEHSGSFKETAVHTGTFAQEIITLVHKVKETYFKGENVTLNDRFTSFMTGNPEVEEESPVNRRVNVAAPEAMPIFSKIEGLQARPLACEPGDLRYDLERRRQERLEGVKITISGVNAPPAPPESFPDEPFFTENEEMADLPEQQRQWSNPMEDMHERMSGSNHRRRRFNRPGPHPGPSRRQYPHMNEEDSYGHHAGVNW